MKSQAFTLIEILVVVLIIGILAAIAVPQYKFAVEKSQVAQVLSAVADIVQAQEFYYLANGHYTKKIEDLDININFPSNWKLALYNDNKYHKLEVWKVKPVADRTLGIVHYYNNPGSVSVYPGETYCYAKAGYPFETKICQSIGKSKGDSNSSDSTATRWII